MQMLHCDWCTSDAYQMLRAESCSPTFALLDNTGCVLNIDSSIVGFEQTKEEGAKDENFLYMKAAKGDSNMTR